MVTNLYVFLITVSFIPYLNNITTQSQNIQTVHEKRECKVTTIL